MNVGYIKKEKLGEGAYAVIYLADEVETLNGPKFLKEDEEYIATGRSVAIKVIKRTETDKGLDVSAIREIKAMKLINCAYVLKIHNVFIYDKTINIVLEYMETSLDAILQNKKLIIMPKDIKSWMLMILKGVYSIHKKFIVHRDIKPNNILVSRNGILKIADFGLAREIDINKMTSNVVTRWYRAPELFLGCRLYTFAIDVWAIGCIFAELFLRVPFLVADSDLEMLDVIFRAMGTPTKKDWPGMSELPNYVEYPVYTPKPIDDLFSAATNEAIDLLKKMLIYDPTKRITILNALKHNYFKEYPRPTSPEKLPFEIPEKNSEKVDLNKKI